MLFEVSTLNQTLGTETTTVTIKPGESAQVEIYLKYCGYHFIGVENKKNIKLTNLVDFEICNLIFHYKINVMYYRIYVIFMY